MKRPEEILCVRCHREAIPQGSRGRLRFECDECRKASRNARDRARRAALGKTSRPKPSPTQITLGDEALGRLQQIHTYVEYVVDAARAVESSVWPKPIGEDGQRALSLMVMRLLDLHRVVEQARRVIDEMQGELEEPEEP
ncbi:MAG: hypothetical protein ACYDEA_04105 [Candidatus Dormibacteria bacterium]